MTEILRDTFTASNQPLQNYDGDAYVRESGSDNNARIEGNALRFDTGGFASTEKWHHGSVSIPDGGFVQATWSASNTGGLAGITLYVDDNNKYMLFCNANELYMARTRGGSYSVVGPRQAPPFPISDGVTVKLRKNGTVLEAYYGDLSNPVYTYDNAQNDFGNQGMMPGMENIKADLMLDDFVADNGVAGAVPAGTVTVNDADNITHNSARITFDYDLPDAESFEYDINGGTPISISGSPIILDNLAPESSFLPRVRAVNSSGAGSWFSGNVFNTLAAPLSPPTGSSVIDIANATIGYNSASFPYGYDAGDANAHEYSLDDGNPVAFDGVTINIPNLSPETSHTLKARAKNDDGDGAWSPTVNFTTTAVPVSPPALVPTNISIVTTTTSATVTFTYPGGDADSYEYQIDGGAWVEIQTTSFQLDGLSSNTLYVLNGIRAKNSAGVGDASPPENFTTQANQRGVLGSEIPSTGEDGPSILYPHINLPADANVRFYVEAVSALPSGMTLQDSGVLTWDSVAAGRTEIQVRAYRDGVEWTPENTNNLVVITGT